MSILDSFDAWKKDIYPVTITQAPDENGNWVDTPTLGTLIRGVKYNRSEASRFFSQTWASNITDVIVLDVNTGLKNSDKVSIDGVYWQCDTPVNVGEQNEIWLIGLERKA